MKIISIILVALLYKFIWANDIQNDSQFAVSSGYMYTTVMESFTGLKKAHGGVIQLHYQLSRFAEITIASVNQSYPLDYEYFETFPNDFDIEVAKNINFFQTTLQFNLNTVVPFGQSRHALYFGLGLGVTWLREPVEYEYFITQGDKRLYHVDIEDKNGTMYAFDIGYRFPIVRVIKKLHGVFTTSLHGGHDILKNMPRLNFSVLLKYDLF